MLNILQANNGILRSVVAKEVRMRFVPELRFFYDDTLEQIENIENMINKVRTEAPYKEHYGDESVYDTTKNIKLN
ncbi:Ribosome-binding factor A [bioreactor metagenome]|uniref:Ribosome-binding factor A n=1 Tax=bioreactor metagenome TaxID=1076179 RepID=A0A645I1N6_9ZZZZ